MLHLREFWLCIRAGKAAAQLLGMKWKPRRPFQLFLQVRDFRFAFQHLHRERATPSGHSVEYSWSHALLRNYGCKHTSLTSTSLWCHCKELIDNVCKKNCSNQKILVMFFKNFDPNTCQKQVYSQKANQITHFKKMCLHYTNSGKL